MSKAELLQEVAKMSSADRDEFWVALCSLEEEKLFRGTVSEKEKTILDAELREYEVNPQPGTPWSDVKSRLLRPS